jgi:hypothetical protein
MNASVGRPHIRRSWSRGRQVLEEETMCEEGVHQREGKGPLSFFSSFVSLLVGWLVIGLSWWRGRSLRSPSNSEVACHVIGGWPVCGSHYWPTIGLASFIYRAFLSGHHEPSIIVDPTTFPFPFLFLFLSQVES